MQDCGAMAVLANDAFITWRHPDKIEVSIEVTEKLPSVLEPV